MGTVISRTHCRRNDKERLKMKICTLGTTTKRKLTCLPKEQPNQCTLWQKTSLQILRVDGGEGFAELNRCGCDEYEPWNCVAELYAVAVGRQQREHSVTCQVGRADSYPYTVLACSAAKCPFFSNIRWDSKSNNIRE